MRAFSKLNIFGYFIVEFVAVSLGDGVGGNIIFYVSLPFLFFHFYFSAFSIVCISLFCMFVFLIFMYFIIFHFCIVIAVFFVVGIARGE